MRGQERVQDACLSGVLPGREAGDFPAVEGASRQSSQGTVCRNWKFVFSMT